MEIQVEKFEGATYLRGNGKWAKVAKVSRGEYAGKWMIARGWKDNFSPIDTVYWPRKWMALDAAENWIRDNG